MSASIETGPNPAIARRRNALIWIASALASWTTISTLLEGRGPQQSPPAGLRVDVNTAPRGVLEALPRIGPALSGRIVEGRQESPFVSLDDVDRRVRGIGPATIAGLRPYLRFD